MILLVVGQRAHAGRAGAARRARGDRARPLRGPRPPAAVPERVDPRDLGGRGGMAALVEAAERDPRPTAWSTARGSRTGPTSSPGSPRAARCSAATPRRCGACAIRRCSAPRCAPPGSRYPRTFSAAEAPARADRARRWLRKPVRGGGGPRRARVARRRGCAPASSCRSASPGSPCSAAAVADGRSAALLGVSEQLIGRRALGARGFTWCGNLVPPRLPARERRALRRRGAGDLRAPRRRVRPARPVRRGPGLGRRARRGWSRSTRARPRRSRRSRPCTACARSRRTWRRAPGACRRPRGRRPRTGRAAGKAVVFATEDVRVAGHARVAGPRHPRRAAPRRADRRRPSDLHARRDGPLAGGRARRPRGARRRAARRAPRPRGRRCRRLSVPAAPRPRPAAAAGWCATTSRPSSATTAGSSA